ncbi:MAG: response regulator [Filomicrobium sp.]
MNTASPHVLVVDDDREIRELVARHLKKHGFKVDVASGGAEMKEVMLRSRLDLIVLDRVMPGDDGLTLCRNLRATSNIPVILLTLLGSDTDRIVGLEVGADDYLPKPFNTEELVARIRAVLRRAQALPTNKSVKIDRIFSFAGWTLDCRARRLTTPDGVVVTLTDGEFELLRALAERPGVILSRDELLDLTSRREPGLFDRGVDMQIMRLRRKLSAHTDASEIIKTIRQQGYMFTADVEEAEQ